MLLSLLLLSVLDLHLSKHYSEQFLFFKKLLLRFPFKLLCKVDSLFRLILLVFNFHFHFLNLLSNLLHLILLLAQEHSLIFPLFPHQNHFFFQMPLPKLHNQNPLLKRQRVINVQLAHNFKILILSSKSRIKHLNKLLASASPITVHINLRVQSPQFILGQPDLE